MFGRVRRLARIVFGDRVLADADPEDLFDISTGYLTLGANGYDTTGHAGLCFGTVDAAAFREVEADLVDFLDVASAEAVHRDRLYEDDFGYTWVLATDDDFEALVTAVYGLTDTLIEAGFGQYLLSAAFAFEADRQVYLVYNFKRGQWYPFVPQGEGTRDTDQEAAVAELLEGELDLEADRDRQYGFWDIPL